MTARELIVSEFPILDGVIAERHKWSFPCWNDEIAPFKNEELFNVGALVHRYQLLVYPLVLSRGQRLFAGDDDVSPYA